MIFRQFLTPSGCASYVLGCGGEGRAAVVDPAFEIDQYIETATVYGMTIEAILSTHVHADHRSGERELAARTGAPIYFTLVRMWHFRLFRSTIGRRSPSEMSSSRRYIPQAIHPRAWHFSLPTSGAHANHGWC